MEAAGKMREKLRVVRLSRASWFKLELDGKVIHFDAGYTGYFHNQYIPEEELRPKADYLLVTHFHKDHLQPAALEKILTNSSQIIASKSCQGKIGRPFHAVLPGDRLIVDNLSIQAVPAYNTLEGSSTRKVHHKGEFVGFLVQIGGWRLYFAGDTDFIPEMKELGYIDVAFLPIGGTFVMDWEEAVRAALVIRPQYLFPMHESHTNPASFQEAIKRRSDIKSTFLRVGESVTIA